MLTVKNLSFSSNGDMMHSGCTKGITIFAVPWKMQDMMNKEEEEEQCYNLSTLKSVANVRKHISSGKVELPATLLGLTRLFNNYCHLLNVLFGPHCPHLVHTRDIRDAQDNNQANLETRITQKLFPTPIMASQSQCMTVLPLMRAMDISGTRPEVDSWSNSCLFGG